MLYPQQNAARLTISLDGIWDFALDQGDPAAPSLDPAAPLPGAERAAVPASFNDQNPDRAWRDHYGWVFYQRKVTLPRSCAGQRVVLRFGSVTHQAMVWLDGVLIARHQGGFLPFEADLTGRLAPGATALLTVAADNRVSHSTLPVGNEPGEIAFFGSDNAGIQRPVTLVCCQNDYTKDITTRTMDVVCLNRYYGWYNLSGDLDAACAAFDEELDFWETMGRPVVITEYGADTVNGLHDPCGGMFSEEFQAEYYERMGAVLDGRSFLIGEMPWNFADFATIQGPMRVGGNRKGLLTWDRRPKLAAHTLRRRWNAIPTFDDQK